MNVPERLHFPPFHLDLSTEQLWHDTQVIPLRQKTLAVLRYLLEHPNQLVTLLGQYAPTWLVQMPTLVNATELEELRRRTQGGAEK